MGFWFDVDHLEVFPRGQGAGFEEKLVEVIETELRGHQYSESVSVGQT
jgi:hypothetical protein